MPTPAPIATTPLAGTRRAMSLPPSQVTATVSTKGRQPAAISLDDGVIVPETVAPKAKRPSRAGQGHGAGGQGRVERQAGVGENLGPPSPPKISIPSPLTQTVTPQRLSIPLRTGPGMNIREHHYERSRRVKRERIATAWAFQAAPHLQRPALPVLVTLTRCGPSRGLDDDNLAGSLKGVRDAVAEWLLVDDADPAIRFAYTQRREKAWTVQVALQPMPQGVPA